MDNNWENPSTGLSIRGLYKEAIDLLPVGDASPNPTPRFPKRGERDHRVFWVPRTWGWGGGFIAETHSSSFDSRRDDGRRQQVGEEKTDSSGPGSG